MNFSVIYIILVILLQSLVKVKSQITTFKPDSRHDHVVTLIGDKLYILGGTGESSIPKESFLCLNVSAPFNTSEMKWYDLSKNNTVPPNRFAAAIKGGANNNTLFIYGGESLNNESMALVYTFDAQNNLWRNPEIIGTPPIGKLGITLIVDYNGLIYLFGGNATIPVNYTNDMFILDSINLSWKKVSSVNAPSQRTLYGAVFLPNKKIIYMGM
jgi:N-acetylneuraminic acid mutarotase